MAPRHMLLQVIARVQGLTMLNASAVRERERRDCELRYLRAVLGEAWLPNDMLQHWLTRAKWQQYALLHVAYMI